MKLTLIPTLFSVPAFIILIALGTWQIERLEWKQAVIGDISVKIAQPAVLLPETVALPEWQYRKVLLTGTFLKNAEIYLYTGERVFRGEQGYNIFAPLRLKDGRIIFIDRGWIPAGRKSSDTRPGSQPEGLVQIEGMLMKGEEHRRFVPENNKEKNIWFWADIPSMAVFFNIPAETSWYIRNIGIPEETVLPVPGDVKIAIRNDHLQYAITWYSLAFILVVIYFLYHWKRIS